MNNCAEKVHHTEHETHTEMDTRRSGVNDRFADSGLSCKYAT